MRKLLVFILSGVLFAGIFVGKDEAKRGDLVCVGDTAVVEGEVKGDLVSIACTVKMYGQVKGDMISIASKVYGEDGAEVNGDLVLIFSSGNIKGIKVKGSIVNIASSTNIKKAEIPSKRIKPRITIKTTRGKKIFNFSKFLLNLIFWIVLSLFTLFLFEKRVLLASSYLHANLGKSWIRGVLLFIAFIILLVIFAVLSVILIGIPFLLLTIFLLLASMVFGYTSIFHIVGKAILSTQTDSSVYYVLLGAVIFCFLNSLFLIKDIVSIVMFPIALGVSYLTRFGKRSS